MYVYTDSVSCAVRLCLFAVLLALPACSQARDGGFGQTRQLSSSRCPTGQVICSRNRSRRSREEACVTLSTDPLNCGACGAVCSSGAVCSNSTCIDLQNDTANCGAVGNACPAGWSCCSGSCVNTLSSITSCGACGNACSGRDACSSGRCTPTLPTPPTIGGSVAASLTLGPFSTCDSSGNALATTTPCSSTSAVPAIPVNIKQSHSLAMAIYPLRSMCMRVSTCSQVQLLGSNTNSNGVTFPVTDTVLSWTQPDSVPAGWPAAVSSCSQNNCGDGSTLSQMILPNSGRDETVWLTHSAGSCLRNVYVLLTVSATCTLYGSCRSRCCSNSWLSHAHVSRWFNYEAPHLDVLLMQVDRSEGCR